MTKSSKSSKKFSIVRADSGVYFAIVVSRREREASLVESRHIYQWDSAALPRKALNCEDLALIGAGTGTRISGACSEEVLDVRAVIECTPEATARFLALPDKA